MFKIVSIDVCQVVGNDVYIGLLGVKVCFGDL